MSDTHSPNLRVIRGNGATTDDSFARQRIFDVIKGGSEMDRLEIHLERRFMDSLPLTADERESVVVILAAFYRSDLFNERFRRYEVGRFLSALNGHTDRYPQPHDPLPRLTLRDVVPADVLDAPPPEIVNAAIAASLQSPCRSQRGVVIFHGYRVIASGWNAPPAPLQCDRSDACRANCSRAAIHAEQRCLLDTGRDARGHDMLHVKTVDGALVASGGPSCLECSKLALAAGIAGFWLFHESGWIRYDILDFHQRTIEAVTINAT